MLEKGNDKIIKKENIENNLNFEAKQNLLGFFDLLLKIDMRNNPELYKKQFNKNDENNRDTNNSD